MKIFFVCGLVLVGFFSSAEAVTVRCRGDESSKVSLEINFSSTISAKVNINGHTLFIGSLRQSDSAWYDEVVELVSARSGEFRFSFDRYSHVSGSLNYLRTASDHHTHSFNNIEFRCDQTQFLREFYNALFSLD